MDIDGGGRSDRLRPMEDGLITALVDVIRWVSERRAAWNACVVMMGWMKIRRLNFMAVDD